MQMSPSQLQSLLDAEKSIVVVGKSPGTRFTTHMLSSLMVGDVMCTSE